MAKQNSQRVVVIALVAIFLLAITGFAAMAETTAAEPIQVGALKGPTGMGLVKLMDEAETNPAEFPYQFTLTGTADEVVTGIVSGNLQAAAVPCNLASVLYNKTEGKVRLAAVNTLGVLYIVENGDQIHSVADLAGKTIYSTGKGTSPEFVLKYILKQNQIDPEKDLTIEYKSEATEIAALFKTEKDIIALLPQPYVTIVQMQNDAVRVALNMTEEWQKVNPESTLVTGCVIVRDAFVTEHAEQYQQFMKDYEASTKFTNEDMEAAAALIEKYAIVPKAAIALKAIPACNITFITGEEMSKIVSDYLNVLFETEPKSVGGKIPDAGFYLEK